MQPPVLAALENWKEAHEQQQLAAAATLRASFPSLALLEPPTGCCDIRLEWSQDAVGSGSVCVDEDSRATIESRDLPQAVVGAAADEMFGMGWFDGAPDGIARAGPGTYNWDDDATSAELEIIVRGENTADLYFGYASVPDAVALLDELHTALIAHQTK